MQMFDEYYLRDDKFERAFSNKGNDCAKPFIALIQWYLDELANILQTSFQNVHPWMKTFKHKFILSQIYS